MARILPRIAIFAGALALNSVLVSTPAFASLDMVAGARNVVPDKPVSECSAKAKTALNAVLTNAFEAGEGTGQWAAYGQPDSSGHATSSAAIHCFPVDHGYVATITCAAEVPPNALTANDLCAKLSDAFGK